jgi:hypothetical protein
MKKVTVTYIIDENNSDYDLRCSMAATDLNGAVWDALQKIRNRLKYCDNVSEAEINCLEEIRSILGESYVEE